MNHARRLTVKGIAEALCSPDAKAASREVTPPWMQGATGDCDAFSDAWRNVQTLKRQRDELLAIWPDKKDRLESEFNDTVMKIAADFMEASYT